MEVHMTFKFLREKYGDIENEVYFIEGFIPNGKSFLFNIRVSIFNRD